MSLINITNSVTERNTVSLKNYFADIVKYKVLNEEEEVELVRRIHEGDKSAMDRLVLANQRFLVSAAKQYSGLGVDLEDLIQEGNLGLIKAAQRFDETRGFKFISFAVWWIRQSILKAVVEYSRTVRIPANVNLDMVRAKKTARELEQKLHRRPSMEEIAWQLDWKVAKVEGLLTMSNSKIMLDEPLNEDADADSLLDVFVADEYEPADLSVERNSEQNFIIDRFDMLKERESKVLKMLYGIGEEREFSLEEIATELGISRESVRDCRDRALKKLRNDAAFLLLSA